MKDIKEKEHSGRKNGTSKLKRKRKRIKNATIEFKCLGHLSCDDIPKLPIAAPNTSSTSILDKVKFFDQNDIEARVATTSTAHFRLPMRIWVSRERQLLRLPPALWQPCTLQLNLYCSSEGRRHRMLMGAGHLQKPFWSVRWANGNVGGGRRGEWQRET